MEPISKQKSYLSVVSPFDGKSTGVRRFEIQSIIGKESLCDDFNYSLEISTKERMVESEFNQLLGGELTVCFDFKDQNDTPRERYINGVVYSLKEKGMSRFPLHSQIWRYQVELASWMSQLKSVKDCRIFYNNNNTALSIVTDLLSELGLTGFKTETQRTFPKREYVTMYNETYFDFIVRVLQEAGIIWRFEHEKDKHTLVLYDDAVNLPDCPSTGWAEKEAIKNFCKKTVYIPIEGVQTSSFDNQNPPVRLVNKPQNLSKNRLRHYEYPGNFQAREDGESKMDRLRTSFMGEKLLYEGASTIRALEAGKRFKLNAPTLPDLHSKPFLIRELSIEATEDMYTNQIIAMPGKHQFFYRSSERRAKPLIVGNQTAVVVGESNSANIHIDKLGSAMVRFHWDHHSPPNTGSAFIRNVMPAAGNNRGFIFHPNIGDEVVVKFEDGDPDRPLIVGRVYASFQRAPVKPGEKPEQSVIQPKDGVNANRILFDDKKDTENLEIRAKKDMNIKVGDNCTIDVERNWNVNCKNLEIKTTGNIVKGNMISLAKTAHHSAAGANISNSTGLAISEIAGTASDNEAGANTVNTTLGMIKNSAGGAVVSKSPLVLNTAVGDIIRSAEETVCDKGMMVVNTGTDLIDNHSVEKIGQDSKLAILTNAKNIYSKTGSQDSNEALMVKEEGNVVINK